MLEIRKVQDNIKTCFFKLNKLTLSFTPKQKNQYFIL